MYTKRVSYSKEFLTGTLAGISVRCGFDTTDDAVAIHLAELNAITKQNPGSEVLTAATFWVYNIGCEDIQAKPLEGRDDDESDGRSYLSSVYGD